MSRPAPEQRVNSRIHHRAGRLATMLVAAVFAAAAGAAETETAGPDTSTWSCEFCQFSEGWTGGIGARAGYVTDSETAFGRYTGYEDSGVVGGVSPEIVYWGDKGFMATLQGFGYSQESFDFDMEAGRQGKWMVNLGYDRLPYRYLLESTQTIYRPLGDTPLRLPDGWVRAGGTGGMTNLASDLRGFDPGWDRETLDLGAEYLFSPNLTFDVDWRYQTKEGKGQTWGTFLGGAAELIKPLNYETNEVEGGVNYTADRWQVRLAYLGSWFSNKDLSLQWENAFTGPDDGRMAQAPDNKSYNVSLSGAFSITPRTVASGTVSLGQTEQDDTFLPYTINPALAGTPLPRSSFDGKVDLTQYSLRVTSAEWSRLRLTGDFRYNERDNKSSRDSYDYVLADNIDGGVSVENLPYGFKDTDFDLAADYRIARRVKGSVGYDYDKIERNLQEVNENEEDTFWAKLRIRPSNAIDIDIKGQTASRDGSTYRQVGGLKLEQNPLLRKYNMADRDRDGAEVRLQARPSERLSFGVQLDTWTEDYKNSEVGLTDADRDAISADASYAFSDDMHLFVGISSEQATFKQRGAQSNVDPNTAPPNWRAKNKDDFDSATVGFRWDKIAERWGLELDYTYAESQGSTSMGELAAGSGFPDFRSERNTARLDLTYELSPRMQLRGGWLYERYRSSDWHVDGTSPDTLSSVLTWGAAAADYEVSVVGVSFTYRLDLPKPPLEY